jgi:hypothetical protein
MLRHTSASFALKGDLLSRHKEQTWMEQQETKRMMWLPKFGPTTEKDAKKKIRVG